MVLVLDESDPDILAQYLNRISSILKGSIQEKKDSLSSVEELTNTVERLGKENAALQRQLSALQPLSSVDEFTRTVLLEKIAGVVNGASTAEVKEFIDYLSIFENYKQFTRGK